MLYENGRVDESRDIQDNGGPGRWRHNRGSIRMSKLFRGLRVGVQARIPHARQPWNFETLEPLFSIPAVTIQSCHFSVE